MSRTRKDDKKVRITIRSYESTIKKIKDSGSSLQREWDKYVENKWQSIENEGEITENLKKGLD